ncbi:MAG: MSHA biogenesis protein MshP [Candidatus Azotimanducaceae bacterium]|jgi:MSHA biogenesis protein MshP
MFSNQKKQQGVGLVGAIFVIVIVSILSVAMSQMVVMDSETQNYEILSLKAFMAAESGAQLGVNRILPPSGGGSCAARTFTFLGPALKSCQAVVTCAPLTVSSETFYTVTSAAQCLAGAFVTERTIQVRIRQ